METSSLHTLLYVSTATEKLSDQELTDILAISRKNNTNMGITGIMIYGNGNIMQLLEGEKQALDNLYQKLKQDHRHFGLTKLLDKKIDSRSFESWSMGFKAASKKEYASLEGVFNPSDSDTLTNLTSTSDTVISIIKHFAATNN
ncbi:BLUF domain-containing protein [Rubrolithibacter danxiaensis]|uniref:BLUF domain-containing protein n=1 Tax=Rubrolithibacter danxiaensis TaxID=3390805 RepID=UPI003BF819B0